MLLHHPAPPPAPEAPPTTTQTTTTTALTIHCALDEEDPLLQFTLFVYSLSRTSGYVTLQHAVQATIQQRCNFDKKAINWEFPTFVQLLREFLMGSQHSTPHFNLVPSLLIHTPAPNPLCSSSSSCFVHARCEVGVF